VFFTYCLILSDLIMLGLSLSFMLESIQEQEPRAPKFGAAGVILSVLFGFCILWVPFFIPLITTFFVCAGLFALILLIPGKPNPKALKGAAGYLAGQGTRHDERDIVFARNRIPKKGSDIYNRYYKKHPEREKPDEKRRDKGVLGVPGSIDRGYRPNLSMLFSSFDMPDFLGVHARQKPHEVSLPFEQGSEKATEIVKRYAEHLGADMVGVCRVNPLWLYSHRGEVHYGDWEEWGKEIGDLPRYAVIMLTEMDWEHVSSAPHTPSVAESAANYAKGAYLGTMMASYFSHLGYQGIAQNTRNYDGLLVPMAIDAGLGELGRQGYLIAPKFGARVRIFATFTDMPLVPDKPISIGADEFCRACKKCAETCPSRSIPLGDKVNSHGIDKWKLDAESCFEFWGKVGTDCSICMAICPFSRPDTFSHRLVRWLIRRSWAAKILLPHIDNIIYGRKWKPRQVSDWLDYPKGPEFKRETYDYENIHTIG